MYICLTLENISGENMNLPYDYERYIQGFLYSLNDPEFGAFLHNVGYVYNSRNFKLFTFSQFLERPIFVDRENKRYVFPSRVTLLVSSVNNPFLENLVNALVNSNYTYRLGAYHIAVTSVSALDARITPRIEVRTTSPVCIYSTVVLSDGRKRTIYYTPDDQDFYELLRQNAIKKYQAYYGRYPENDQLTVRVCGRWREINKKYKGFIVKGISGRFLLEGSPELIVMVQEAGLGGKNAEGNGLVIASDVFRK